MKAWDERPVPPGGVEAEWAIINPHGGTVGGWRPGFPPPGLGRTVYVRTRIVWENGPDDWKYSIRDTGRRKPLWERMLLRSMSLPIVWRVAVWLAARI